MIATVYRSALPLDVPDGRRSRGDAARRASALAAQARAAQATADAAAAAGMMPGLPATGNGAGLEPDYPSAADWAAAIPGAPPPPKKTPWLLIAAGVVVIGGGVAFAVMR